MGYLETATQALTTNHFCLHYLTKELKLFYNQLMGSQIKFGQNIRIARNKTGFTQKQIADRAGVHVNYYARIERGEENPSYEALEKIIKALGVKSSEVLPF